jgi:Heme NO binding.
MKGTIVKCMQELVEKKFGAAKWLETVKRAGLDTNMRYVATDDIADADVMKLVKAIGEVNSLSADQVIEAFGDYWSSVYAPSLYGIFFDRAKNTKELLSNLDHIHDVMTKSMKGAAPPHFTLDWQGEKVMLMKYRSPRGLAMLMPGLIRGIAKHYKEHVKVDLVNDTVRVQFPY